MDMTHQSLCKLAVKWLQRAPSAKGPACQVAFSETKCAWDGEIPDAIGFRTVMGDEGSCVVEVKISRADFLADRNKPHRQVSASGMGLYRYYMTPEGVISASDLQEGWGLIEVSPRGVLTVLRGHVCEKRAGQVPWRHERTVEREWLLLATMLSRVGDVERLHSELKKERNERAKLARSNDVLRRENRELDDLLFRARNPEVSNAPKVAIRRQVKQAA